MSTEKHTFSSAVDEVISRSGRKDRLPDIVAYINQSIRECSTLEYFDSDMIEDQIVAASDNYVWTKPTHFRLMRTVRYPNNVYPKFMPPGRIQKDQIEYYYQGPTYFVFNGTINLDQIDVAYYAYPRRLLYTTQPTAAPFARPAIYLIGDEDDGFTEKWQYLSGGNYLDTLGSTAANEAAQELVTNWLLFRWYDLIVEGALAKLFKNIGSERAVQSFALYKQTQEILRRSEPAATLAY